MTNAESLRRARAKARADGRCITCRHRPAKPECVTCEECLGTLADRRKANVARGLCGCGNERVPGRMRCRACLDALRARQHLKWTTATTQGLCGVCWAPAVPGRTMCEPHLERLRLGTSERIRGWRAAGLCITCGGELTLHRSMCEDCIPKQRAREAKYRRRKRAGLVGKAAP